LSFLLR